MQNLSISILITMLCFININTNKIEVYLGKLHILTAKTSLASSLFSSNLIFLMGSSNSVIVQMKGQPFLFSYHTAHIIEMTKTKNGPDSWRLGSTIDLVIFSL